MNMKTRTLAKRIALLAVVALLLVSTLASCAKSAKPTLTVGTVSVVTEKQTLTNDAGEQQEIDVPLNGLKAEDLNLIANMLSSVYTTDFDTHAMLVAAQRGYDMTDANFKDSDVEVGKTGAGDTVAIAKSVLTKANDKASADKKVGADKIEAINAYDVTSLINCFKTTVDTASSTGLLNWIGVALGWITNTLCFGSYFFGICLFAVVIELLMIPFAIKQQKNSIRQAMLRPKEMAIRNKYKGRNDQVSMQKLQQEIQEFYQRENFSPFSGCLPLLIQLPIIMVLYSIIINPLQYVLGQGQGIISAFTTYCTTAKAAGGMGLTVGGNGSTIALLSDFIGRGLSLDGLKDFAFFTNGADVAETLGQAFTKLPDFTIGKINFGLNPSFDNFNILLLVPVLTFATYFGTSKLNRKFMYQPATNAGADARQTACSNSIMDVTMPMMSTVFTFMVPALVGIYWIFRSLVGLLKQFIISRLMPLPTFTEEDYKAAAREMAGSKKPAKKSGNPGAVRSLHYIDDEDFEDTRERGLKRRAALEEAEREKQEQMPQKSDKTPFAAIPMKEDRKNEEKAAAEAKNETTEATPEAPEANGEQNDNQKNDQE